MKSMKSVSMALLIPCVLLVALNSGALVSAAGPDDIFMIRSTTKAPEAVVQAIKAYAEQKNWQYLGASKVKQGQVTLVKICVPEVGKQIWPVGLHLSALLPCGNIGVYRKGGQTEISLLHARYMHMLYPHPAVEKASATAGPLLSDMLESVVK
jgi:uncharacterized protein (DUF302 family)